MVDAFGPFLSAFLSVVFDRIAKRELVDFFRKSGLDESLLDKLKMSLLSVNVVLADAEEKEVVDPFVKEWMDKLKEVIYNAEDLLDELATKAMCDHAEDGEFQLSFGEVRDFITSLNPFSELIQSRIEKIAETLESVAQQKEMLGLKEVVAEKTPSMPTTSLVEDSEIYGRECDKDKILKFLLSPNANKKGIPVVAIVGISGIGKTTLAQLLYNHAEVSEHFNLLSWVHVSEKLNVCEITKKIYESITMSCCNITDLKLLQLKLKESINEKRFLIVLDDFCIDGFIDWDILKKPFIDANYESRIMVTTRRFTVASTVCASLTHQLSHLSNEDSWKLFVRCAFKSRDPDACGTLKTIGQQIVKKCYGLPIAAKILGSLLHDVTDVEEWDRVMNSKLWDIPKDSTSLVPAIRLGYNNLPSHLKRCFAYCSLFPKGYEMRRWHLVCLWMAEGLLPQPTSAGRKEDIGNKYIDELLSISFLQVGKQESCVVMHDLAYDLARHVAGDFVCMLESSNQQKNVPLKVRHLSYFQDMFVDVEQLRSFTRVLPLRTFLPFRSSENVGSGSCANFPVIFRDGLPLRTLSLSHYDIRELSDSMGKLIHLRYLDLSHTQINQLPCSFSSLYNLETVLLTGCSNLNSLPSNLSNLVNLRHLDISGTRLSEMPMCFNKLNALQVLTDFFVGRNSGSRISELGELSELRGELSIVNLQNVIHVNDAVQAKLQNKKHLVSLELKWTTENHDDIQNETYLLMQLHPHEYLKKLIIENFGGSTFPNWLGNSHLTNLVYLELTDCTNCLSLPAVGQLPSLLELYLRGFTHLQTVGPEFYGAGVEPFKSLTILKFEDMSNWREWLPVEVEGREFPSLVQLYLQNCPLLVGRLPGCQVSPENLLISGCPNLVDAMPR